MEVKKIEIHTTDNVITIDDNNINGLNNDDLRKGIIELIESKSLIPNDELVKDLIDINQSNPNILKLNKPKMTKDDWFKLISARKLTKEHISQWLSQGNCINDYDEFGCTVLIWACERDYYEIAKLLIENSADVNYPNARSETALMWACNWGCYEIVKLLTENSADVNIQDRDGRTALMWACDKGRYSIAQLLIECGADVNLQSNGGWTVLMMVCGWGYYSIVKLLLENGADYKLKSKGGKTVLEIAKQNKHEKIVKLLTCLEY